MIAACVWLDADGYSAATLWMLKDNAMAQSMVRNGGLANSRRLSCLHFLCTLTVIGQIVAAQRIPDALVEQSQSSDRA
ncbi:hypothetical protein SAMN04487926_10320 [Paraburkholderia steynii]|uniref:Uncharacterized protein n=1 Tax=Paraburkholderia steynii TaxID=1245441 RepID=A0A7Z7B6A1_9BURK|nr:hypothetical protein SAMN04487926_10320 [Paraburkholderia steynii]